jgi:hypothetical protein
MSRACGPRRPHTESRLLALDPGGVNSCRQSNPASVTPHVSGDVSERLRGCRTSTPFQPAALRRSSSPETKMPIPAAHVQVRNFRAPDLANSSLGRHGGGRRASGRVGGEPSRPRRPARGGASDHRLRTAHRHCRLAHGFRRPARAGYPQGARATLFCPLARRSQRPCRGSCGY